ncbi:MAG TPA: hypothetical protein VFF73_34575 [Planctomycetota bacterium]|nr:hypothetical protein [Planctomycetota bacterium]
MPRVLLSLGAPVSSRVCVVCGEDGARARVVTFRRTRPVAGISQPFVLTDESRSLELPFHDGCHVRWRLNGALALVATMAAILSPFCGWFIASSTKDPSWTTRGFGTGVVLLGFPLAYGLFLRWRGPVCIAFQIDSTLIHVPSVDAALALGSDLHRGESLAERVQHLAPRPVPEGATCARHAGVPARFACARCGQPGCRDCELRVGSPGVLLCGGCLRQASSGA